jgi:uncharacterized membrane protein
MRQLYFSRRSFFIISMTLALFLVMSSFLFAQGEKETKDLRPERGIAVYTEYSGIAVSKGETVKMDLTLENKGRTDETIDVKISTIPKGWKATLKGASYSVTGMYVSNGKSRTLSLALEPDKSIGPGTYDFQFDAQTADGKFTSTHKLTVAVQERMAGTEDLQVATSYPVLRGQTDATFEFSIEVTNKLENERTVNLSAIAPEKWEINFKPSYETKLISSFVIKGGQNQNVAVQVNPPKDASPGEYPILVRVGSGEKRVEVKLMVVLTGIYKIDAGTPSGVLSLEAVPGKPANFSLFIRNTGSAINRNVTFSSFKPENWDVTFKPEKIDALEPNALKQVEVTVKPASKALVGDYSVAVMVNGEKSDKTVEMRVTVKASTAWGWIGTGIIIFVIAGLSALFIWLGRR